MDLETLFKGPVHPDTQRWVLALSENTEAMKSLVAFLDSLGDAAQVNAMQPRCTPDEWRSCQVYHKLVMDVKSFIANVITQHRHVENMEQFHTGVTNGR